MLRCFPSSLISMAFRPSGLGRSILYVFGVVLLAHYACPPAVAAPLAYFVSPSGSDTNPGTVAAPFQTLQRARDAIREATGRNSMAQPGVPAGWEGATVTLRGGVYPLADTFRFDARDSGSEAHPIIYVGAAGEEAVISGEVHIPANAWQPLSRDPMILGRVQAQSRDALRQIYLPDLGAKELGDPSQPANQRNLTLSGRIMQLAPDLEHLDQPGEWYPDVSTLRVFCFPGDGQDLGGGILDLPVLIAATGCDWVTFSNLTLQGTSADALSATDSSGFAFDSTVRNTNDVDLGPGLVFYVSQTGSDTAAGTQGAPFRTLEAARNAIRAATGRAVTPGAPPAGWKGATVVLSAGVHTRTTAFTLDGRDSGAPTAPIIYRAAPGATVVVSGAKAVPQSAWRLVTTTDSAWSKLPSATRGETYMVDVAALGVTDFGGLFGDGEMLELSVGGRVRQIARYPEIESSTWLNMDSVVGGNTFSDADTMIDGRMAESSYGRAWGYWGVEWTGYYSSLASVSGGGPYTVTLSGVGPYGLTMSTPTTGRYCFVNFLKDLRTRGRYVWDLPQRKLYYLPEAGSGAPGDANLTSPGNLVEIDGANWVGLLKLTLKGVRKSGVQLLASTGFSLTNCILEDFGKWGLVTGGRLYWDGTTVQLPGRGTLADGATRLVLSDCTFRRTGSGAVFVAGGDRARLVRAENVITNNTFTDNARIERDTWVLRFNGMGYDVTNNIFQNCPAVAVSFMAVESYIAHNEFSHVVTEEGDAGAIYTGWSLLDSRNSVIEYNTFNDVGPWASAQPPHSTSVAWAVYLDATGSGVTVRHNTMNRCGGGILFSGRDNTFSDNVFTDCHNVPYVKHHESMTIMSWAGNSGVTQSIDVRLANIEGSGISVADAPWNTYWPEGARFLPGGDRYALRMQPENNVIVRNRSTTAGSRFGPPQYPYFVLCEVTSNAMPTVNLDQINFDVGGLARPLRDLTRRD